MPDTKKTSYYILIIIVVVVLGLALLFFVFYSRGDRIEEKTASITIIADSYPESSWVIIDQVLADDKSRIRENDLTPISYQNLAPGTYLLTVVNQDPKYCSYSEEFNLTAQEQKTIEVTFLSDSNCLQEDY